MNSLGFYCLLLSGIRYETGTGRHRVRHLDSEDDKGLDREDGREEEGNPYYCYFIT